MQMVMPPPEEEVLKLLHYSAIHPLSENLSCLMCFIKNFSMSGSSDRILRFIDIVRNDQGCAVFFFVSGTRATAPALKTR